MVSLPKQIPLLECARIALEYYPTRAPRKASSPFEVGCYTASLLGGPAGEGLTERDAIEDLARVLRGQVAGEQLRPGSTAVSQALNAARLMDLDSLTNWLSEHADEAVLHESPTSNRGS